MIKLKKLIIEGGNVKFANSFMNNKYIEPTLKKVLAQVGWKKLKYDIVGNTTKPYSGDIDLAIDSKHFLELTKFNGETIWDDSTKYLNKKNLKYFQIFKGMRQISIIAPLIDNKGKHLNAVIDREGTVNNNEKGYVQVDFMIGNLDWMKNVMKSPDQSNYKMVYKQLFFADILGNLIFKTKDPEIKKKLQIDLRQGLQLVDFTEKNGKKNKIKIKVVSGDVNKLTRFLFGGKYTYSDSDSFEKVYKLFKSNDFKFPQLRNAIINTYKNTMARLKLPLPKEIK